MRRLRFGDDRGQALIETAISLPLFILAMYGLFWSLRISTLSERLQIGTRYGGLVSSQSDPYQQYSLYSMYATLDGASPTPGVACGAPAQTNALSGRKGFFTAIAPVPNPVCTPSYIQFSGPETYTEPIQLESSWISLAASVPVDGLSFFNATAPPGTVASQNFFRAPNVGQVTACSTLGGPFKKSLEPATDTAPPTTPATAFPVTVATDAPNAATCVAFGPAPPAPTGNLPPTPTPPPTATPTPTPVPTKTPTPSPTPTASPVPTKTPTPSPSPVPTATPTVSPVPTKTPTPSPTPTASPVPTKTPTPSPSPTKSPTPSPSPVPTATPTPSPVPTKTPTPSPTPTKSPTPSPSPTATPTKAPTPTPSPTPDINGTPPGNSNS